MCTLHRIYKHNTTFKCFKNANRIIWRVFAPESKVPTYELALYELSRKKHNEMSIKEQMEYHNNF